jgi:hypothetical protein
LPPTRRRWTTFTSVRTAPGSPASARTGDRWIRHILVRIRIRIRFRIRILLFSSVA